jgi:hypothetical protein
LLLPSTTHGSTGHWDPADLNSNPWWSDERGLNSLQILAFLLVTIKHMGAAGDSGSPLYQRFVRTAESLLDESLNDYGSATF